jgi:hypothetical protein
MAMPTGVSYGLCCEGWRRAKDSPFGVPLDCVVFATSAGYDNLQILMNKAAADYNKTAQAQ